MRKDVCHPLHSSVAGYIFRINLHYSEESEPEETGNIYTSTVWNDALSIAVGSILMLTLSV